MLGKGSVGGSNTLEMGDMVGTSVGIAFDMLYTE